MKYSVIWQEGSPESPYSAHQLEWYQQDFRRRIDADEWVAFLVEEAKANPTSGPRNITIDERSTR